MTAYRESFFPPASLAQHGLALGSARAGNAIGGGDWTADQPFLTSGELSLLVNTV